MDSRIDETAIGYPPAASRRLVLFSELVSWCTSELVEGVIYGHTPEVFPADWYLLPVVSHVPGTKILRLWLSMTVSGGKVSPVTLTL